MIIVINNYSQTFNNINAGLPQVSFSSSSFGDTDNDGDLDLYISGLDVNSAVVGGLYIFDNGHDTYSFNSTSGLPAIYLGNIAWGDLDNDSDLDIVIIGQDSSYTDISAAYINNGDGTFTNLGITLTPIEQGSVSLVDFNNDGNIDISITGIGSSDRVTEFYRNDGNATFTKLNITNIPGMNSGRIRWADYNNDDYPDFILTGFNDGGEGTNTFYTKIFNNNGDETFSESTINLHQGWLGDVEWGDYNSDGYIDLVISGTGGSGTDRFTLLYKNNGDGTFSELDPGFPGVSHSSLEWGDFDKDGDLDLFITGVTSTPGDGNNVSTIFTNIGDDMFTDENISTFNTSYYGDADSGDIDGDGKLDIVITGYDDIYVQKSDVYKNTTVLLVSEINNAKFNIYPNPTINKQVNISINDETTIDIYSISGEKVDTRIMNNTSKLDFSNLDKGIYILKLSSNDKTISKKLIIK